MKLTTIRIGTSTRAARVEPDGTLVRLASPDVGALIRLPQWRAVANSLGEARHEAMLSDRAPVISRPRRVVRVDFGPCGVATSTTRRNTLIGPKDDIVLTSGSTAAGWNARLAVVIGTRPRSATQAEAEAAIAGFSLLTDVNAQTPYSTRGDSRWRLSSFGPTLVTPDELPGGLRPQVSLRSYLEGHLVRDASVAAVPFDPVTAVRHISQLVQLEPGDVVALATGGETCREGGSAKPHDGSVLEVEVDGIGFQENAIRLRTALVPKARHRSPSGRAETSPAPRDGRP